MTTPIRFNIASFSAPKSLPLKALAQAPARTVDVSSEIIAPAIIRGGFEVPAPSIDPRLVADVITRYRPIARLQVPRAVSQSIPAGTHVAKGTPVDIVFVPASDIDLSIFAGVHADFASKNVAQVLPIVQDATVLPILQKASFASLTEADKTSLSTALNANNIGVVPTDPTRTLEVAFNTLQSARAFQ